MFLQPVLPIAADAAKSDEAGAKEKPEVLAGQAGGLPNRGKHHKSLLTQLNIELKDAEEEKKITEADKQREVARQLFRNRLLAEK